MTNRERDGEQYSKESVLSVCFDDDENDDLFIYSIKPVNSLRSY